MGRQSGLTLRYDHDSLALKFSSALEPSSTFHRQCRLNYLNNGNNFSTSFILHAYNLYNCIFIDKLPWRLNYLIMSLNVIDPSHLFIQIDIWAYFFMIILGATLGLWIDISIWKECEKLRIFFWFGLFWIRFFKFLNQFSKSDDW